VERRPYLFLAFLLIPAVATMAAGGREIAPPAVTLDLADTTYISPVTQDGVQDEVSWNVTIVASQRMVVKGYRIIVTDESGGEVYRFEEFNPARQPIIFRFKRPVVLPDAMSWSGISEDGSDVAEGAYYIVVEGVDDKDRVGASEPYRVIVDNTPPSAAATLPYSVFSPNSDGNKDILVVEQTGTSEAVWTGAFVDSGGTEIYSLTWSQMSPQNLVWDGVSADGGAAPDGTYQYVLSATDLAGNSFATSVADISIDTKDTPISLSRNVGFFSPNRDGATDTVTFTFEVPVTEGVREWSLRVLNASGTVRMTASGQAVPSVFEFDGRDAAGDVLPEGAYTGNLSVVYLNGNTPSASSAPFTLDITPPTVLVTPENLVFSPNGDGRLDTLRVFQETSVEELWTGRVYDSAGTVILETAWRAQAEWSLNWDGSGNDGTAVPDGEYRYVLSSRDRAGNYSEATVNSIRIDTRETPVALTASGNYFSPNADGVRDTLAFLPRITDPNGVVSVTLVVTNEAGNVVRQFQRDLPEAQFIWAGRGNDNQPSPDGSYNAELSVLFENGNNPTARTGPVVIDRARPRATVNTSHQVFSPDGDGSLDTVELQQSASSMEDTWTGTFRNEAGQDVRVFQWTEHAQSFVWDGTDNEGNRVPDGIYQYTLTSTDRAGNAGLYPAPPLTIDTRPTPVAVRIDSSAFSPDANGSKDELIITPVLEIAQNVERWSLQILNGQSVAQRTLSGDGNVPSSLSFDGRNDSGQLLPEGPYTARLSVLYRNGSQPTESSPVFDLDTTRPTATISAVSNLFSPNGDGRKDSVQFGQVGSDEETWTGLVVDANGSAVREFTWLGALTSTHEWDGNDNAGQTVADGVYGYSVSATDRAGNIGTSGVVSVRVDNRPSSLSVTVSPAFFSPNGDGINDSAIIAPTLSLNEGISVYRLDILNRTGRVVHTIAGTGSVPGRLNWPGRTDGGANAADGVYTARLTVEYSKGDQSEARTGEIVVDTVPPQATISAAQTIFSPEGDGRKDSLVISQQTSVEDLWEASVYGTDGQAVRTAFWAGAAEAFEWNGGDDEGSVVGDGVYRYELRATDRAGNTVTRSIPSIRVDTRSTSAFVNPSASALTPNGDGTLDSTRINLYPSLSEGIIRWSLVMVDRDGRMVRDLTTGSPRTVPSSVTWDGRLTGNRVVDGSYSAKLTIEYEKGNLVESTSSTAVLVDVSGPLFTVSTAPTPFSPDGDGENDTVRVSISRVTDASSVASWQVLILDPYDNVFYQRSGNGAPPASFQWDGLSASGELVQAAEDYRVNATLTDTLGNVGSQTVVLPVDVLVIREGDTLKIRISSIQFAPNSADLVGLDQQVAVKNTRTLTRLAEILRKYSAYQIRIEGHAVSVYWENPTRAAREERDELQPLSQARADAVRTTLVNLGIPAARMTTVGIGGQQPIVPHGDLDNRWKNRRVEFVLIR
jgi:flagellar hook assembly protein FlgD/outer membrane protein OmpA-like peptidoglycan-associated protein